MRYVKTVIIGLSVIWFLVGAVTLQAQTPPKSETEKKEQQFEALYRAAKSSLYRKNWPEAVDRFREIVKAGSQNKRADESLYWLAYSLNKFSESRENLEKILAVQKEALSQLETLIKEFPSGKWVDDAGLLRVEIAEDLFRMGFKEYKKYIVNGAAENRDMEMKLIALDALLHMDKEKAFPIVEKIVRKHKDPKLRERAIFVLSQIRDPRVAPLLVAVAMKDAHWKTRERAIFWLGQSRGRGVPDKLVKIYHALGDSRDELKLKEKVIFSIIQADEGDNGANELIGIYRKEKNLKLKKKIIFWLGQSRSEKALQFIEKILLE